MSKAKKTAPSEQKFSITIIFIGPGGEICSIMTEAFKWFSAKSYPTLLLAPRANNVMLLCAGGWLDGVNWKVAGYTGCCGFID